SDQGITPQQTRKPRTDSAQTENALRARTRAGMAFVKRRGKHVGRPHKLTPEKLDLAHKLLADGKGRAATARAIGVDPATLRRHLNSRTL
ncbi:helix-turn-helix domain-containing protein, partial [Methylobacterium oryzisoli]